MIVWITIKQIYSQKSMFNYSQIFKIKMFTENGKNAQYIWLRIVIVSQCNKKKQLQIQFSQMLMPILIDSNSAIK